MFSTSSFNHTLFDDSCMGSDMFLTQSKDGSYLFLASSVSQVVCQMGFLLLPFGSSSIGALSSRKSPEVVTGSMYAVLRSNSHCKPGSLPALCLVTYTLFPESLENEDRSRWCFDRPVAQTLAMKDKVALPHLDGACHHHDTLDSSDITVSMNVIG